MGLLLGTRSFGAEAQVRNPFYSMSAACLTLSCIGSDAFKLCPLSSSFLSVCVLRPWTEELLELRDLVCEEMRRHHYIQPGKENRAAFNAVLINYYEDGT